MRRLFHSYNKKLSAGALLKKALLPDFGACLCRFLAILSGLAVSLQPAAAKDEMVWHVLQLHRSLGTVDIYVTDKLMRLEKSGGDIIVLYRFDTDQVNIISPGHKCIYSCSRTDFYNQGFSVTSPGLKATRAARTVKRKQVDFMGQPANLLDVYVPGISRTGKKFEVNCAGMKVLAAPGDFRKPADVVETIYATPITGALPLEMRLDYSPGGGELWFRTSERDLKKAQPDSSEQSYYRLKTMKLTREKKPQQFFAVPQGFKKLASQGAVINETDTASELTKLILPSP
jgi:hypothetical protein